MPARGAGGGIVPPGGLVVYASASGDIVVVGDASRIEAELKQLGAEPQSAWALRAPARGAALAALASDAPAAAASAERKKRARSLTRAEAANIAGAIQQLASTVEMGMAVPAADRARYTFLERNASPWLSLSVCIALSSGGDDEYGPPPVAPAPKACEDCGRRPAELTYGALAHLDPRATLSYCDRRFAMEPGAAAAAGDALAERRRAVRDFNHADEVGDGVGMFGVVVDGRMELDALNKKLKRRQEDALKGVGHCGVICCEACRAKPGHTCVALCGTMMAMSERF